MGERGDRRADRLAPDRGGRPLRRRVGGGRRLRRARARPRRRGRARARRRARGARRDRGRRPRPLARARRRHHGRHRQDDDEGHPRRALRAATGGRSRRRATTTTSSACRSRSAGSSRTPRSASSRWACAASARSPGSRRSRGPTSALITNIAPVHLELVETVENVARAKAELIEALPPGGIAVVPEEPLLEPYLTRTDIEIRRFGQVDEPGRLRGRRPRRSASRRATRRATSSTTRSPRSPSATCSASRSRTARSRSSSRALREEELELPGRRAADQRLLQREPALDARGARAPRRARGRRGGASRCSARWPSSGRGGGRYHREVGAAVAERRRRRADRGRPARARVRGRARTASPRATPTRPPRRRSALAALLRPGDVVLVKGSRAVGLEAVAAKLTRLMARVLVARARRADHLAPRRARLHRLPAPARVRPADPRGGAASTTRQAGHADDGRRPDRGRGVDRVPRTTVYTLPALDDLRDDARLRRDRLRSTT